MTATSIAASRDLYGRLLIYRPLRDGAISIKLIRGNQFDISSLFSIRSASVASINGKPARWDSRGNYNAHKAISKHRYFCLLTLATIVNRSYPLLDMLMLLLNSVARIYPKVCRPFRNYFAKVARRRNHGLRSSKEKRERHEKIGEKTWWCIQGGVYLLKDIPPDNGVSHRSVARFKGSYFVTNADHISRSRYVCCSSRNRFSP